MSRVAVTEKIVLAKVAKGIKWGDVAAKVGLSKEWVTAACLGQMTLTAEQAAVVGELFDLDESERLWLQELIHDEFGDGIMSAIDFHMDLQRVAHEKGDRVSITMSGKFLPYKTY